MHVVFLRSRHDRGRWQRCGVNPESRVDVLSEFLDRNIASGAPGLPSCPPPWDLGNTLCDETAQALVTALLLCAMQAPCSWDQSPHSVVPPAGSFLPKEQRQPSKQPLPNLQGEGSRDARVPRASVGTAMMQMRLSPRDGTRETHMATQVMVHLSPRHTVPRMPSLSAGS